ncbi:MAG: hypothetical protein N4A72_15565, partial [Bacteroidales bacterium]|nr:hypothetical protein [Bacteroidales bacterium]
MKKDNNNTPSNTNNPTPSHGGIRDTRHLAAQNMGNRDTRHLGAMFNGQGSSGGGGSEGGSGTKNDVSQQGTQSIINMPKGGGAIQGIGEKFETNPVTGTYSMSVPLAISPGRSG